MRNLYERYNMNGLIPKEKQLYLPYSQRTVSVVYFDASEVFASLLSCPTLNQDEMFYLIVQRIHLSHHREKHPMLVTSTQVVVTERHTRPW